MVLYTFLQMFLAILFADFIMGLYHWFKDSYFNPHTPIIGKSIIWNSRLHHVKPRYILQSSNLNIIWESALWTMYWMIFVFKIFGFNTFNITLFIAISLNDVIHKYAHMQNNERPYLATLLQNCGLLQSYEDHHKHHTGSHITTYCAMTPYLNNILEKFDFWRKLENLVYKLTDVEARSSEDIYIEDSNYPGGIKFIKDFV